MKEFCVATYIKTHGSELHGPRKRDVCSQCEYINTKNNV